MTTATLTTTTTEWERGTGPESEPEPRAGMRLSAAEFMELPDTYDRRRMELDDGALYIMPRPRLNHQSASGRITHHFLNYQDRFEEPPFEVYQEIILELWPERPGLLLSPDLVVLRQGGSAVATETRVTGAPDIVVEILSSDRNRIWCGSDGFMRKPAFWSIGFGIWRRARLRRWRCRTTGRMRRGRCCRPGMF